MATNVTTLKNAEKTDDLLPRTEMKAIFDSDGNYLDSGLKASDLNALKGGVVDELVRFTEAEAGTPIPTDADTLEGHPASYFATASEVSSLIESGTGYIRYSDGTQICYGRVSETGSITTSYASWYSYDLNGSNFAKPFVADPTLTLSSAYTSDYIYCMPYGVVYGTTGITNIRVLRPTTSGSGVIPVNYIAIGRWK